MVESYAPGKVPMPLVTLRATGWKAMYRRAGPSIATAQAMMPGVSGFTYLLIDLFIHRTPQHMKV